MNYKNRSENYNVFKNNNTNIKSPKNQMKTVLKIFKIFIYLSLFVFSMVGCVQSFVVGTSNYIGRGIELYANEGEVIPNVTEIHVDKVTPSSLKLVDNNYTTDDKTDDVRYTFDGVFDMSLKTSTNTMIKPDETDSNNNKILEEVHNAIKIQNKNANLKLSDAYRGLNETVSFMTSDNAEKKVTGFISDDKIDTYYGTNKYIALSSKADQPQTVGVLSNIDAWNLLPNLYTYGYKNNAFKEEDVVAYTDDESTKDIKENLWGKSKTGEFVKKFNNQWLEVDKDLSNVAVFYSYKVDFVIKDKDSTLTKFSDDEKGARDKFRILMLNELFTRNGQVQRFLTTNPEDINKTDLTTWLYETNEKGEKTKKIETVNITPSMKQSFNSYQQYFLNSFLQSYILARYEKIDSNNINSDYHFVLKSGDMVAMGTKQTDYRPLVTWGQAWKLGPFYGLFVFPLGKISTLMISTFPIMNGWGAFLSILIIVLMSRILTFLLSFKSTLQQTKMQELNAKKAMIDAKYAPYKGNKQMENRQKQEVAELYKKEGINPLASMGNMFLTMPMFLSIWRIVSGVPMLKAATWLGMTFATTSYKALLAGGWQYLWLILLSGLVQFLSMYFPKLLTKKRDKGRMNKHEEEAMKKNNKTQNIMTIVMIVMAVAFSAGVQIYWVIGGLWRILEVYITHVILKKKSYNKKKGIVLETGVPWYKKMFKKKETSSEE